MKKSGNSSRKNKTISIRQHLPLSVRVHYDTVRNFAPVKAVGMGVMVLIGVFGVLLATQTVSPTSSASVNEVTVVQAVKGVTASKVSESGGELVFDIDIVGPGRLADSRPIEYYTVNSTSAVCSQSTVVSGELALGAPGVVSIYDSLAAAGTGGQHTAAFASNAKSVCVRVRHVESVWTVQHQVGSQIRISWGFYSIAVNRAATPTRATTPNFTVSGVNQTGYEVSFVVASTDRRVPTSVQVYRATGSSVTCPESSGSYPHNASLASTYPGGTGRVYRVAVLIGSKNICVKVNYAQSGSAVYEVHGPFPVNASSAPLITIVKGGDREYGASASYVVANSWENVVNSSRTCTEGSFVHQGSKVQGVQNGSSYTVPNSVSTAQNGKYVCFRVQGNNNRWSFRSTIINVPSTVVTPVVSVTLTTPSGPTYADGYTYAARDTAGNAAANTWHHIVVASAATCQSSAFNLPPSSRALLKSGSVWRATNQNLTDNYNKYICFRARNSAGTGFGSKLVNIRPSATSTSHQPVVVVDLRNGSYVARNSNGAVEVRDWVHVFISSSVSCNPLSLLKPNTLEYNDNVKTGNIWNPTTAEQATPTGKYICFAGGSDEGEWGFGSRLINVVTPPPVVTSEQPVVVTPPTPSISITSNNREYTASASDVDTSSWQHVIKSSSACAKADFAGSPQSGSSYTVSEDVGTDQNGEYVCFGVRGTGTNGVWGYKSTVINVTVAEPEQTDEENREGTAEAGLRVDNATPDGGKQDDAPDVEEIATAGGDEERNWSQLAGYLLVAGAALGIACVLIVKKYKQMG